MTPTDAQKPLTDDEADAIKDAIRLARRSERERCARIVEHFHIEEAEWDKSMDELAAMIRALRDERS
jgi:hypothetical protein